MLLSLYIWNCNILHTETGLSPPSKPTNMCISTKIYIVKNLLANHQYITSHLGNVCAYPMVALKLLSSAASLAYCGSSLFRSDNLPLKLFLSPPPAIWDNSWLSFLLRVNNVGINHCVAVAYCRQIAFNLSTFCSPKKGTISPKIWRWHYQGCKAHHCTSWIYFWLVHLWVCFTKKLHKLCSNNQADQRVQQLMRHTKSMQKGHLLCFSNSER